MESESIKNILVSGASGIVGYGILKCLKNSNVRLFGSSIYDDTPANCFSDVILNPPASTEKEYIPWLLHTIKEQSLDMIIPGIELDMEVWNNNRDAICETGCIPVLNDKSLIELCLDKWAFYQKMEDAGIECRIKTSNEDNYDLFNTPFVVKPRKGFGSQGFRVIHNRDDYNECKSEIGNSLIIQEMVGVPEQEYTIACFFDFSSELKAIISLRRKLSKQGYTELAEVVDVNEEIKPIIMELARVFRPVGPTDFQFRRTENGWKLLEINPRISSSTSIRAAFGYNEAKMCIDYFIYGKDIEQPHITPGKAIRYVEDYIIKC